MPVHPGNQVTTTPFKRALGPPWAMTFPVPSPAFSFFGKWGQEHRSGGQCCACAGSLGPLSPGGGVGWGQCCACAGSLAPLSPAHPCQGVKSRAHRAQGSVGSPPPLQLLRQDTEGRVRLWLPMQLRRREAPVSISKGASDCVTPTPRPVRPLQNTQTGHRRNPGR